MPPTPPQMTTAELVALLSSRRLPTTSERDQHAAVSRLLDTAADRLSYQHEAPLDRKNRPDFLTKTEPPFDRYTAIEIKLRCTSDAGIMRQLIRYALTGQVAAIILITGRHLRFTARHLEGPEGRLIPLHIIRPTL